MHQRELLLAGAENRHDAAARDPEQPQELAVPGPVHAARPHHAPRQPRAPDRQLAGQLAAAVGGDGPALGVFGQRRAAGRGAEGGLRGDVHETLEARRATARGVQEAVRAGVVDGEELGFVLRGHEAGHVVDDVDAGQRRLEAALVLQRPGNRRGTQRPEFGVLVRAPREGEHVVAARCERLREVTADESGGAGDERLHSALSYIRSVLYTRNPIRSMPLRIAGLVSRSQLASAE